jgi:pectin methylesterase-like acyl-CoA thioesterase
MAGIPNPSTNGAKDSNKFLNSVSTKTTTVSNWMSSKQLALLIEVDRPADAIVAKDSFRKFKSIQAAVNTASMTESATTKRYVFCIKAADYDEQVTIPKQATNFMFISDAATSLIIMGNKNVVKTPSMTTFLSASLTTKVPRGQILAFAVFGHVVMIKRCDMIFWEFYSRLAIL